MKNKIISQAKVLFKIIKTELCLKTGEKSTTRRTFDVNFFTVTEIP